ncbi:MAG: phosphatase PAP2 family protein [Chlamydiia bacterium]
MEPLYEQQLALLETIVSYRKSWLDPLFLGLNYIDSFWGYLMIILVSWLKMGKLRGFHLFCLYLTIYCVVFFLKTSFQLPRPPEHLWMAEPSLSTFPSGGAANLMVLFGFLITQCKRPIYQFLLAFTIFLNAFSRLYLGVHFPIDVLSGLLIGLVVLILYFQSIDAILTITHKIPPFMNFLTGALLLFLLYFNFPKTTQLEMFYFLAIGVFSGMAARSYLPLPFAEKKTNAVITCFLFLVFALFYHILPQTEFPLILPFLFVIGITVPLIAPWFSNHLLYPKNTL